MKKSRVSKGLSITTLFVLVMVVAVLLFMGQQPSKQNYGSALSVMQPVNGEFFGDSDERTDGTYFTLYDEKTHEVIDKMAREVNIGDELITEKNVHYKVAKVEGDKAYCSVVGKDALSSISKVEAGMGASVELGKQQYNSIGVYCTHSDESYVPTSGTESKDGDGDILKVGDTIASTLEEKGVNVIHSKNVHDPHDVNSYHRSRRTAAELLSQAPATIIDVHRDGVPDPNYYATELNGKPATQIRLVVGKQNQNMEANLDFAKRIKAYYDETAPGLIKSIFMAKGNYNQDMAPNSMLIEVGTHTNSLEEAQQGAAVFASLLPDFLGVGPEKAPMGTTGAQNVKEMGKVEGGSSKAIIMLVVVAVIGIGAFFFINRGTGNMTSALGTTQKKKKNRKKHKK